MMMSGLLHLVQRGGDWAGGPNPPSPLLAVLNVAAHPSAASAPISGTARSGLARQPTASVLITVLLYNGPLLCGFNVPIKGNY